MAAWPLRGPEFCCRVGVPEAKRLPILVYHLLAMLMVNNDCQVPRILSQIGGTLWGMSLKEFLDWVDGFHSNCGRRHSIGWEPK